MEKLDNSTEYATSSLLIIWVGGLGITHYDPDVNNILDALLFMFAIPAFGLIGGIVGLCWFEWIVKPSYLKYGEYAPLGLANKFTSVIGIYLVFVVRLYVGHLAGPVPFTVDLVLLLFLSFVFVTIYSIEKLKSPSELRRAGGLVAQFMYILAVNVAFSIAYVRNGIVINGEVVINDPASAIYFSLVTFTTVGYGDIHPTKAMRLYAGIHALFGYLSLGVFVALLIKYISHIDHDEVNIE